MVSRLPYPRVKDREVQVVSLIHDNVVACTPTSQVPRVPSSQKEVFEVNAPKSMDVSELSQNVGGAESHSRLEDTPEVEEAVSTATAATNVLVYRMSFESLPSPMSVEEEKVDYKASDNEIRDKVAEENVPGPSTLATAMGDNP